MKEEKNEKMIDKNNIPESWEVVKLGDVCDKISLNGIKIKQKQYLPQGKFPVVDQGQELIGGYYNDEKLVVGSNPPYIIFGDHTKVKKFINFKFIAGADGVKVLKPWEIFYPKLFFYFIHSIKIPDKGYARHFQFLETSEIPLPPLPEQHRIVSKIEELFTELDKGIETLKTTQQQLKVYRQAVLKWAFEGRLNYDLSDSCDEHEEKPNNQDNHIHHKNHSSDNGLPDGWEWKKLGDVGTWKGGGTPSKAESKYWNDGTILWVSPKDMKSKVIHNTEDKITPEAILNSSAKLIPKDSILFVVRSGILRRTLPVALTETEVTVNQDLHALTPFEDSSKYIYWFVVCDSDEIRRRCSKDGTTVESIESSLLKNYLIPIPSRKEQRFRE